MTITERALVMIQDCIDNGITEANDIIACLIDDEVNEVSLEAIAILDRGEHMSLWTVG